MRLHACFALCPKTADTALRKSARGASNQLLNDVPSAIITACADSKNSNSIHFSAISRIPVGLIASARLISNEFSITRRDVYVRKRASGSRVMHQTGAAGQLDERY